MRLLRLRPAASNFCNCPPFPALNVFLVLVLHVLLVLLVILVFLVLLVLLVLLVDLVSVVLLVLLSTLHNVPSTKVTGFGNWVKILPFYIVICFFMKSLYVLIIVSMC